MGQSKTYKEKYLLAKDMYLNQGKSLTQISKELKMDRGILSNHFKEEGIEIINKQNMVKFNENYFDTIDTEEKAYWLGFLYADGYISNDNGIELSLKASDINHLIKFKDALNFIEDKHIFIDDIRCRISFRNKHLNQALQNKGCINKKSLTLIFPDESIVPQQLQRHFVRGYIDGDGYIGVEYNKEGKYIKCRLLILGTKNFLQELIKVMNWKENKIACQGNIYRIEYGGKFVFEYFKTLYENANIYLDRKYEKYEQVKKICQQ